MQAFNLAKRAGSWLLIFAACVAYFYGLGYAPFVGPDEPRYAQVAREMYARGDLITPTLAGMNWFEKPALLYWLMFAAYGLFGASEFAARLGPACMGLASAAAVWLLCRKAEWLGGRESEGLGLACAATTLSSAGMLVFSRGASFDIILTATVTFALSFFFASEIESDARRRRMLLAGFYASVGLSLIAKGLVGAIIPFGVTSLYFILRREWRRVIPRSLVWGLPLALLIASLWYAPVIARHGWTFIDEFFVKHHFARYISNKYHHPQPFYYFFGVIALLALPWTAFLAGGLWHFKRVGFEGDAPEDRLRAFAFAWLVLPVAFFSLSGSKLPGYILPALPGAMILAGARLREYAVGERGVGLMRATGGLAATLGLGGLIYAYASGVVSFEKVTALTFPAFVVALIALVLTRRRKLCSASVVGGTFLSVVLILSLAIENFAKRESMRAALIEAERRGLGDLPVAQLHAIERTSEYYAAGRLAYAQSGQPLKLEGPVEVFEFAKERGGRALVFVPMEYLYQLENRNEAETSLIDENGSYALVYVNAQKR